MTRLPYRRLLALTTLIATLSLAASAPAATRYFRATPAKGATVGFPLRALPATSVRSAYVRAGRTRIRVGAARVRAALKTRSRTVRVRVPRARRARPVLVVEIVRSMPDAPPPAPKAPVSPPAEAAPATPDVPDVALPSGGGPTRPWGSAILSDAAAAAKVVRSAFEPRGVNATANRRVPTAPELTAFRAANTGLHFEAEITGDFTGTTDEILQWASWKWGLDAEVLRAVATNELWWRMSEVGDAGQSFGLMQIKRTFHGGTHPLSAQSTAFNVDYYGAVIRQYYDGHAGWVEDVEHGRPYSKGDLWGAVGAHYAGRWYTAGAEWYIARVQGHVAARTWLGAGF